MRRSSASVQKRENQRRGAPSRFADHLPALPDPVRGRGRRERPGRRLLRGGAPQAAPPARAPPPHPHARLLLEQRLGARGPGNHPVPQAAQHPAHCVSVFLIYFVLFLLLLLF